MSDACGHVGVPAGPPWVQSFDGPVCGDCGVRWPGHKLSIPMGRNEGYGALADQPSWHSRVETMISRLAP